MLPKRSLSPLLLTALVASLFSASGQSASAAIYAYDDFNNYSVGELDGLTGGVGWLGSIGWGTMANDKEDVIDTSADPLGFSFSGTPALDGGDRAVRVFGNGPGTVAPNDNGNPIRRSLYKPVSSNELWVSFLWKPEQDMDGNDFFVQWFDDDVSGAPDTDLHDDDTTAFGGFLGSNAVFTRLANANGKSQDVSGSNVYAAGSENFVAVKLEKTAAGGYNDYDRATMWFNPKDPLDFSGSSDATVSVSRFTGMSSVQHIGFRTGTNTDDDHSFLIDNIRVGSSRQDIKPQQTLVYEGFQTASLGDIQGQTIPGGIGFDGAWDDSDARERESVVEVATPLSFTNDAGTINGGDQALLINGAPGVTNIPAESDIDPISAEEVFVRFLMRVDNDEDGFDGDFYPLFLDDSPSNADNDNHDQGSALMGFRSDHFFVRLHDENGVHFNGDSPINVTEGDTYLLVGRLTKGNNAAYTDDYDGFEFWVNPDSDDFDNPLETVIAPNGTNWSQITELGIRTGTRTDLVDEILYDEIMLGTSWHDVVPTQALVPEPASGTLLLTALVLLTLPCRRRRR